MKLNPRDEEEALLIQYWEILREDLDPHVVDKVARREYQRYIEKEAGKKNAHYTRFLLVSCI